jgi:hypothetical protein
MSGVSVGGRAVATSGATTTANTVASVIAMRKVQGLVSVSHAQPAVFGILVRMG